jgi:hypothetical protein
MNPPTNEHVDIAGYLMEMLTPDEMRDWADALRDVPAEMLLDGPPDDADLLLQKTLRQVRRESSATRWRRTAVLVAAAAAVVATAIGGGVVVGRSTVPAPVAQPSATLPAGTRFGTATDPGTKAWMRVAVAPATGWVRVTATVGGIPAGQKCVLEVVTRDGTPVTAGSWLVSPAGAAGGTTLNGSALVDPAQVRAVRVVNATGTHFVTADV